MRIIEEPKPLAEPGAVQIPRLLIIPFLGSEPLNVDVEQRLAVSTAEAPGLTCSTSLSISG